MSDETAVEANVLTLADLEQEIAQVQTVVNQLQAQVAATEAYQNMLRMMGALDYLKAKREALSGANSGTPDAG